MSISLFLSCHLPHIFRMAAAVPSIRSREHNVEGKGTLPPTWISQNMETFSKRPSTDLCSHLLGQNCVTCLHANSLQGSMCAHRAWELRPLLFPGEGLMADQGWAQPSRGTGNGNWIGDQVIDCRTPQGWETVSKSSLYSA